MKAGISLNEMAAELARRADATKDYIASSTALQMLSDTHLCLAQDPDAESDVFPVTEHAHRQIGTYAKIPAEYYDRMRKEQPALLAQNVNTWLHDKSDDKRLVRTLDGQVRAVLSNRYRPLDNHDLVQAVLPVLAEHTDLQVVSTQITDSRFFLKVLFPRIEGEIKKGDAVQAGLTISNSEVGDGSLQVSPLIYRLVCLNGMIAESAMKRSHVGKSLSASEDGFEIFRDATREADDKAFWLKVQDIVRSAMTQTVFDTLVNRMRDTTERTIEAPIVEVVERVARRFTLTDGESGLMLNHLAQGGDLTQWGLLNAITRTSQDLDDYTRATEFERLGGQILELPRSEWMQLSEAA